MDAVKQVRVANLWKLAFSEVAVFSKPIINVSTRTHPVLITVVHALTFPQVTRQPMRVVEIATFRARPTS
jgi:hypothetical protein